MIETKKKEKIIEFLLLLVELILTSFTIYLASITIATVFILIDVLPLSFGLEITLITFLILLTLLLIVLIFRLIIRGCKFVEMYKEVKKYA